MGFFGRFLGKNKEETPCKTQQELLEYYGALGLEKQFSFYDVIGDRNWNADVTKGTMSFGDDYEFEMQILGTFSHASQTWLWAWANEASGLPEKVMKKALQLRKYGETHQNYFLTNSTFDFSENDLHQIGMIASGMLGTDAYFLADYGQGVMVAILTDDIIKRHYKNSDSLILTTFPQFISFFEMNHRNAFCQYLKLKKFNISEQNEKITATRGKNIIYATFDKENRITNLEGNLSENS